MISVCMATYNGERFIRQQLDFILPQLSSDDEIIVSDDGSTDETLEILKSYKDSRIKIFHHERNEDLLKEKAGRNFYLASSNFENAIKKSSGDYIFFADQDDEWMPDKIKKMVALLNANDCVHCSNVVIDENGSLITDGFRAKKSKKSVIYNLFWTPFLGCCMAIRRDALKYILPFPKKCIGHDLWIGCLCAYKKSLVHIEEPLHRYRKHLNNVSPTLSKKSSNSIFFMIQYRIHFLFSFYKRILFSR